MYAGGPWNQSALSRGGEGGRRFMKKTRPGSLGSRNGKIDFSCYIDRHVASVTRAAKQHAARFHSALPSHSCRPAPDRFWLGSRIEA